MAAARERLQTRGRTAAAPNSDHTSVLVLNVCVCGMWCKYMCEWGRQVPGTQHQYPQDLRGIARISISAYSLANFSILLPIP